MGLGTEAGFAWTSGRRDIYTDGRGGGPHRENKRHNVTACASYCASLRSAVTVGREYGAPLFFLALEMGTHRRGLAGSAHFRKRGDERIARRVLGH